MGEEVGRRMTRSRTYNQFLKLGATSFDFFLDCGDFSQFLEFSFDALDPLDMGCDLMRTCRTLDQVICFLKDSFRAGGKMTPGDAIGDGMIEGNALSG